MSYPEITIIISSGRSGTSYLQRTLRDTMDIGFYREPKYIIPIYRKLGRYGDLENQNNIRRLVKRILSDSIFLHLSEEYSIASIFDEVFPRINESNYSAILYTIFQFVAEIQGKTKLGYKFPSDIKHIPTLAKIFPTARFIHLIRDGRDVAISLLNQKWGPVNLYAACRFWAQRTHRGRKGSAVLADKYLELHYEDLILKTDETVSALGNFINQGRDKKQIESLVNQVNATKKKDAIYGWKNILNSEQVFICEAAAGNELENYGYLLRYGGEASISPLKATTFLSLDLINRIKQKMTSVGSG